MLKPLRRPADNEVKRITLANAIGTGAYKIGIGDCIQPGATGHNKYATGAASSGLILGIIVGIIQNGKVAEVNSVTGINGAQVGVPSTGPGTDNETYATWQVDYIPSWVPMEYEADLSAAADTTTDSGGNCFLALLGVSTTLGEAGKLNEASVALFGGSAAQFWSYGVTSYSTTKVRGHIYKTL